MNLKQFYQLLHNGLGYELLRDLALNFTSTRQTENPRGFSEASPELVEG